MLANQTDSGNSLIMGCNLICLSKNFGVPINLADLPQLLKYDSIIRAGASTEEIHGMIGASFLATITLLDTPNFRLDIRRKLCEFMNEVLSSSIQDPIASSLFIQFGKFFIPTLENLGSQEENYEIRTFQVFYRFLINILNDANLPNSVIKFIIITSVL